MFNSSAFPLEQVINRHPLTVAPDTPVAEAIALMSQARSSYVLVLDRQSGTKHPGKLLGIFTKRDVIKVTSIKLTLQGVAIAAVMTQQPITLIESEVSNMMDALNVFRQYQFRHLPVVDKAGQLAGIVTHNSIQGVLQSADWMHYKQVAEVMTTQVIHASLSASILEVAQLMAQERVSCVVITNQRGEGLEHQNHSLLLTRHPSLIPVGIITEIDIIQFQALKLNFNETLAETVMSTPLLLIRPEDSLWTANELMRRYHIQRLVVVGEAGELVGIVTQTSLLRSQNPTEVKVSVEALHRLVEERTKDLLQAYMGLQSEVREHRQTTIALQEAQARLAGILDIAEDAIILVDETQRIQLFNQGAEKIFGYTDTEVLGQPINFLLPERLRLLHGHHISEFFNSTDIPRKMGGRLEIVGRRKDGTEFPTEASFSKLITAKETTLTVILRDITERKRAEEVLKNQLARERLLGAIALRIRQSLDLDQILNTTVAEVRQFLGCDRVIIYRFSPDWSGVVVVESVSPDWRATLGTIIQDNCFAQNYVQLYQSGRIQATDDIYKDGLPPCYVDLLAPFQVRANLVVPILTESRGAGEQGNPGELGATLSYEPLWGLLGAHQCSEPRQWQDWEIDLLKQLATQVAIAIQQAELYQQLLIANQQLQQLAALDGLTQVANRRRFDEYLNNEWQRLGREGEALSLILCDVDCFKAYNDTYGHLAGDFCLQQVASAIRKATRRSAELVARYGGEEFAVVLPNTPPEVAAYVAEEIQSRVRALKMEHAKSLVSQYITVSIGVSSTVPSQQCSPEMLIAVADKALYQAKAQGRDRIILQALDPL